MSYAAEDVEQAFQFADKKEGIQVMNLTEHYQYRVVNFLDDLDEKDIDALINNAGAIK